MRFFHAITQFFYAIMEFLVGRKDHNCSHTTTIKRPKKINGKCINPISCSTSSTTHVKDENSIFGVLVASWP